VSTGTHSPASSPRPPSHVADRKFAVVPHEFLQPGTAQEFEVLAIEAGDNQTLG